MNIISLVKRDVEWAQGWRGGEVETRTDNCTARMFYYSAKRALSVREPVWPSWCDHREATSETTSEATLACVSIQKPLLCPHLFTTANATLTHSGSWLLFDWLVDCWSLAAWQHQQLYQHRY